MTASVHLPFTGYHLPLNSHLAFVIKKINAKHLPSLKIENCILIIEATGGRA